MRQRTMLLATLCGVSLLLLVAVADREQTVLSLEVLKLSTSPLTATVTPQSTSTPPPPRFFDAAEAAQGFSVPPNVIVNTVCDPGSTNGAFFLKKLQTTAAIAYIGSGREFHTFLQLHKDKATNFSSMWDGQRIASAAYLQQFPQSGFTSADTATMQPGFYVFSVMSDPHVRFGCSTGLTATPQTTICGDGFCSYEEGGQGLTPPSSSPFVTGAYGFNPNICPADCAGRNETHVGICGNRRCEPDEDEQFCPGDCAPHAVACGDGLCEGTEMGICLVSTCIPGDECSTMAPKICWVRNMTCPSDCGASGPRCGNGVCETTECTLSGTGCDENASNYCANDCNGQRSVSICGNGICESGRSGSETPTTCGIDCQ